MKTAGTVLNLTFCILPPSFHLSDRSRVPAQYEEIYCTEEVGTDVYLPPEAATVDANQCYRVRLSHSFVEILFL